MTKEYEILTLILKKEAAFAEESARLAESLQTDDLSDYLHGLEDLKNECLIFPPKRANINPEIKPLQKFLDFDYHKIYQANGLDELFFQIAINKGISILPKGTLQGRNFDFKTLPIRDIEDTYYTCLVWDKKNTNPVIPFVTEQILSQFQTETLT